MKHTTFTYKFEIKAFHFIEELDNLDKIAVENAKEATYKSYAPYSKFNVGAAVLLEDGTVVIGSNQENCAYPSGTCAERTTVFYANSQYPDKAIKVLCIAARNEHGEFLQRPISPCGACRQVLMESEKRQNTPIKTILYGTEEILVIESVSLLLPIQFDQSFLNQ